MNENLGKDWVVLVLVVLVGIGLGMVQNQARSRGEFDPVTGSIRNVLLPMTTSLDGMGDRLTIAWGGVKESEQLRDENRRLREQLNAVANYVESQERYVAEYDRLRALIDLPAEGKEKVYADIIAASPLDNQFTIDVGSVDGIEPNQPVVTGEGLLGVVGAVGDETSQVLLLRAPSVKVSGLIKTEPVLTQGFIQGSIGGRLIMRVIENREIKVGTEVMTTGYSGLVPRGIPIGLVLETNPDQQRGEIVAEVLPSAKLVNTQEVVVLK